MTMDYQTRDLSVHAGSVIELYDFYRPSLVTPGAATHWRYSSDETVTFQGNVYTRAAIERSTMPLASLAAGGSDFTIKMPTSLAVVQEHIGIPPDAPLLLSIWRFHADDDTSYQEYWSGRVAEWSGNDREMSARCISELDDPLDQLLPKIQDQLKCVHRFGDARCGIDIEVHRLDTTVVSVDRRTVVVAAVDETPRHTAKVVSYDPPLYWPKMQASGTNDPNGLPIMEPVLDENGNFVPDPFNEAFTVACVERQPEDAPEDPTYVYDGRYNYGHIVRTSDGMSRTIRKQVGETLTIQSEFRTLEVDDEVAIYAGCDREDWTCFCAYDNIVNFGGCNGMLRGELNPFDPKHKRNVTPNQQRLVPLPLP